MSKRAAYNVVGNIKYSRHGKGRRSYIIVDDTSYSILDELIEIMDDFKVIHGARFIWTMTAIYNGEFL